MIDLCFPENCEIISGQIVAMILITNNILSLTFIICLKRYSKSRSFVNKATQTLEKMAKRSALLDLFCIAGPTLTLAVVSVR